MILLFHSLPFQSMSTGRDSIKTLREKTRIVELPLENKTYLANSFTLPKLKRWEGRERWWRGTDWPSRARWIESDVYRLMTYPGVHSRITPASLRIHLSGIVG